MKYFFIFLFWTFYHFSLLSQVASPLTAEKISITEWDIDSTIQTGLQWRYLHTSAFFESKQSICVLEIDLEEAGLELAFNYSDSIRVLTSELATKMGAIAAINGTFFNMQKGGSVCYFRVNDSIINTSSIRSDFGDEAALAMSHNGRVRIISRPKAGWETQEEWEEIMSAGPLLIQTQTIKAPTSAKFNTNRHPRTAIGIQDDGDIVMVTVDGRNAMAEGMSIPELTQLMLTLGCVDALNMDGGGSTSMWIKGISQNGIVNFPSDNRTFDHYGQRTVANIIGLIPKD